MKGQPRDYPFDRDPTRLHCYEYQPTSFPSVRSINKKKKKTLIVVSRILDNEPEQISPIFFRYCPLRRDSRVLTKNENNLSGKKVLEFSTENH